MRLATLKDGRAIRLDGDRAVVLSGNLTDHLCRPDPPAGVDDLAFDPAALGPPLTRPGKIVCLGLNYADHAAETGAPLPERPLLFSKLNTCVVGPGDPIVIPDGDVKVDHEAELAVVIGRPARNIGEDEARQVIGGYSCFNDVSERVAQKGDGQFLRGKSYDTFGPFGPYVATPEEIPDPHNLTIRCLVNGEPRQDSSTSKMVFGVFEIVSYIARMFPLEVGDLICTGTPAGVGLGSGRYLEAGDIVTVEIDGLGSLTNPVI